MTTPAQMLANYLDAERAILAGKNVSFQGRSMGMENLAEIRKGRQEWEGRLAQELRVANCRPSIGGMSFSVASFGER